MIALVSGWNKRFKSFMDLSSRIPSEESRVYFRELHETPAFGAEGNPFDLDWLRDGMGVRNEPANPDVKCIRTQIDDILGEWVVAPGADPGVRLLYLHGGGYVSGSGGKRLPLAANISEAAGCAVLLINYRLAPEHPYPAGLEDCIRAHDWMTANGPEGPAPARATFITGDSAGAGLTLSTLLALRDRGMQLPLGGIPMSAFVDFTLSSKSIQSEEKNDPVMAPSCLGDFGRLYLAGADPRDPLASPVFGDYRGIPPLLIQAGEYEIIRDDSVRTAAKAEADGVEVQLEIWPGMVHVFQIADIPEGREAIQHIAEFMRRCLERE